MINCILGKSKTGKTTHIYEMIDLDLKSGKDVILFVPSQSRAKAEKEYMKILNKRGIIGVNVTTISSFVEENLKLQNLHIEENYMSKLDRKIILTQVIKENPDAFEVYKKVRNYPGFLDVLDIYMDLFRKSELTPEVLKSMTTGDKRTDSKFNEILGIYSKYLEKINEKYIDSVEEMEIFLKNMDEYEVFKNASNSNIYFDGYNNFSNSEYKFIDALIKRNIELTITLNTDITRIEEIFISSSIFETVNKTYKRICAIADKNNVAVENIVKYENRFETKEDIKYIANNLWTRIDDEDKLSSTEKKNLENIEFVMHTNVLTEIEEMAHVIASYLKRGYKYSDFAIYTTKPDEYQNMISKVFYENNLQVYISKNKSISESVLTKYIQSILNLAVKGLNLELIFDILKQGLTDIKLKDIYMLENYMREFNVNKYLVNNKLELNNEKAFYDLDKLNETKDKIVDMYSFVLNLKNGNATDIVTTIYNHLSDNHIFNNFKKIIEPLDNNVINLDMNNFESQVWNKLTDIFDSIIKVYKDEELSIEEFANIFNLVVKDIKIKTLPPSIDQIELLDINVSKEESKKIAFFIGVVEGKFPEKVDEDIIFNDEDLEKLKDKDIELKETTVSKLNMGFFNIYEVLNNISEKLYVYIPAADMSGKATRKSSLITLIEQIANVNMIGKVTENKNVTDIFEITSKDELFMWLIKSIRNMNNEEADIAKIFNVYEYFMQDEYYSKILEFKKDDSNLSKEITDIVYKNEFKTSVSKLELYKKCPFSYFMQYVLKVNQNKEAKVNVLELGSFMHGVLESFSKRLLEKRIPWQEILNEDLETINPKYKDILEEIIYDTIDKNLSKQKQSVRYMVLKRKLINTMTKVIKTIALSYNQSEFKPYDYEIEFKDNSAFLPMEIDLGNDKTMKLIGKIDRVDMLDFKDSMYIRVIDYKSSSKELKLDKIKEGLSLQLITYMMAFMDNMKNKEDATIVPAGMLYFNLSDKLVSMSEYSDSNEQIKAKLMDALKMSGIFLRDIDVLNKMDRNFENNPKESFIDITKRSLGASKSAKALEEKEFEELCEDTRGVLKNIGKEISCGNVKIKPNKKENYCQFCNYSATCRKNITV